MVKCTIKQFNGLIYCITMINDEVFESMELYWAQPVGLKG